VLSGHPYVLIIEDDHFSLLSQRPYETLIGPDHRRFALVRSVSKFLGPDMCLAVAATDPETAERLAFRLSPGTTWVSHILQRLVLAQLTDETALREVAAAGRHYAERNAGFAARLTERGLPAEAGDGLNLWVRLPVEARVVAERLMRRGWLARTGDEFVLGEQPARSHHLRLTVHDLTEEETARLVDDLADAAR
jgi:DNA-binding transcriptional MocR family regulator